MVSVLRIFAETVKGSVRPCKLTNVTVDACGNRPAWSNFGPEGNFPVVHLSLDAIRGRLFKMATFEGHRRFMQVSRIRARAALSFESTLSPYFDFARMTVATRQVNFQKKGP